MSKHDDFIEEEAQDLLDEDEEIQATALTWEGPGVLLRLLLLGGLLAIPFQTFYYAIATKKRLILIQTKQGFFSFGEVNVGEESIPYADIESADARGMLNQHRLVVFLKDGESRTFRVNTFASVDGQSEFVDEVETLVDDAH